VDAALAADCLVPVWDDGLNVMPGLRTLNMLKLRADIQIQRGQLDQARKEVRRIVRIAWRFDGGWSWLGQMMANGFRDLAVKALLRLTARDPGSRSLIDEALAMPMAKTQSLLAVTRFQCSQLADESRVFLAISRDGWRKLRADPDYEGVSFGDVVDEARESLLHVEPLLSKVEATGWKLERTPDARAYLQMVRAEADRLAASEVGQLMRVLKRQAYLLVQYSLSSKACYLRLRMRKLELESAGTVKLGALSGVPDDLALHETANAVQIVPAPGHPILDWDRWDEDDTIAEYPKLKK
jgi:hypothetical protein